jgi:Tol biopolymer transport system component
VTARRVVLVALAGALLAPPAPASADVVVFVRGGDLYRANADGKGVQRLTRGGGRSRPAISLRGRRVVFLRRRGAYTARMTRRGLRSVRRLAPAPDGPRDATQFDVAISRDGRRVLWTELRINVSTFPSTIDYRRYMATFEGRQTQQVAASGGRPFAAFFDTARPMREGITDEFENRPDATTVDQGLCVPDPESRQNGTCGDKGPQAAFDPAGRHLRHPAVSPDGRLLVATAYASEDSVDNNLDRNGDLVLFDVRTALPARTLVATGDAGYGSFTADGRRVVFERGGRVWTVPASGGRARRLLSGRQPTWGR